MASDDDDDAPLSDAIRSPACPSQVAKGIRAIRDATVIARPRSPSPPRSTPIHHRLRAHSQPASQQRDVNPAPICSHCHKLDARSHTIQCQKCLQHLHSVKCAGFPSHKVAVRAPFICTRCATPTSSLPFSPTPPVTNHIVIHGNNDNGIEDVNDATWSSLHSADLSASTPHASPSQPAPHFAPWNPPSPPPLPSQPPRGPTPPPPLPSQPPPATQPASFPPQPFIAPIPPPPLSQAPPLSLSFSLDDLFSKKVRVLLHCPYTSRGKFKNLLRLVYGDVVRDRDNSIKWIRAFSVPKLILFIPPGRKIFKDKNAVVEQRIQSFLNGRLDELWAQATATGRRTTPSSTPRASANIRRATWLAQEGQFRQAAKALTSHGLDFESQEAVNEMQRKHPQSPHLTPNALPPPPPYAFNSSDLISSLNSFSAATAGGPSGLRASHLKDALSAKNFSAGAQLIDVMTDVINIIAAGRAPPDLAPHLCGANLFAANKKLGGHRPIAVGETLRRWASKCLARKAFEDTREHLAPHQLGVGVKGGCEALIHAANKILSDDSIPLENKWVLQVDMENAFNSISREAMLEETRHYCPKLSAWVEYCYGNSSHLFFGAHRLCSSTGPQQGDPLASLLFSLVLHAFIESINEICHNLLLNAWILDDGIIIGPREDLQRVFDLLTTSGPEVGLFLNAGKSRVWCGDSMPSEADPLARGVPRSEASGYDLLGAPVGDITFARKVVDDRILKISQIIDLLPSLNDSHVSFSLLRFCFSLPKFSYCLRTCDPAFLLSSYQKFDSLQYSTLGLLIGESLDNNARSQASLSVKLGGVGLRSAEAHCSAAYIASVANSRPILDALLPHPLPPRSLESSFPLLQNATGNPTFTSIDLLPPDFTQNSLSKLIDQATFSRLQNIASLRDRARLLSLSLPHAGDFLDALPSPTLSLHLDSRLFGKAMGYRLGLQTMPAIPCPADHCNKILDDRGDHAMHCRDDHGIRGGRHDRIRDQIFKEAQRAGLNPKKEMPALIPGSQSRPADVFVEEWIDGKKVAFDVSVVSPNQDAVIDRAAINAASAIEMRKSEKNRKHADNCRASGLFFEPLVVETFGGWDPGAVKKLKVIATQCAPRKGISPALEIKQFFQRLSIALQRGNSTLLLCRDIDSI